MPALSASSKPEFAQPRLSRSNSGHPHREGTNLGVFVPIWLVFDPGVRLQVWACLICAISDDFALLKRGCASSGGLELAEVITSHDIL